MALTGRSVALLATAVVSFMLAVLGGVPALLYVAGLCAGLVAVAVVIALLVRPRLELTRTVVPAIVEPDEGVEVAASLTFRSAVPVVASRWRDRLPPGVRGESTGTVPPSTGGGTELDYAIRCRHRGSHEIGPFTVDVGDVFGLVKRTLIHRRSDRFIVLPRRWSLDVRSGPGPAGTTETSTRLHPSSGLGQDDVIARPYLPGDALKRWHWRATAHHGEPMVRQEESQARPTVLIVLDTEPGVYDARGFEWAVSAAASVLTHYGQQGFDVDLTCGSTVTSVESGQGLQEALLSLALAEPVTASLVVPARPRTTFVMTGVLHAADAARLAAAVPSRDTIAFAARGSGADARGVLQSAGWHVLEWDSADDLAATWSAATGVATR